MFNIITDKVKIWLIIFYEIIVSSSHEKGHMMIR